MPVNQIEKAASIIGDEREQALIERARAGDEAAFGVLVQRYQNGLFLLARNLVGSSEEAEDIAADAFVRAWKNLRGFRGESSFKTWLWKILINLSRSHLRRRYLQRKLFFWNRLTDKDDEELAEATWADTSAAGDPQRQAELKNVRQVVQWTRLKLSRREQEVFALKYDQGLKISEISKLLGIAENTVKVLLFRATHKMAAALKDYRK